MIIMTEKIKSFNACRDYIAQTSRGVTECSFFWCIRIAG